MKISLRYPPNYDKIKAKFNPPENVVFTYGDTLYCPDGDNIPDHLLVHEETHAKQQGDKPEEWWNKYFEYSDFRLEQELEAYHNQYKFYCKKVKDKNERLRFLYALCLDLSSVWYGSMISLTEALKALKK